MLGNERNSEINIKSKIVLSFIIKFFQSSLEFYLDY